MWWFPPLRRRLSSSPDAALSVDDEVTQHNNNPEAKSLRFTDLPSDILYTILSKLPAKEIARSSVLSSELRRCMSPLCPRLTFDAVAICKCERYELSESTQVARFIPHVNGVLQKHRDRCAVVETLEFRTDFVGGAHGLLAHYIHMWVEFAVSSRTKNLSLDLKPQIWWEDIRSGLPRKQDLYVFPFRQLISADNYNSWGSSLQQLHLSFVSFRPPSQFKGFPNLRKLHLQMLHIAREDLEHLLSHCASKIQWLSIDRCVIDDELTLAIPLPSLLYLNVNFGLVTKIDIHAANLATFEYTGSLVPIRLVHSLNLQSANIKSFDNVNFEHVLITLINGIPSVQSLTSNLRVLALEYLEKQWSWWDRPLKRFSNLRHLQLLVYYRHDQADKLLYASVSFLRAAPSIEKLEVHFAGYNLWFAQGGPSRNDLGQCKCKYKNLKNIWISGFRASKGQLEFLLHIIENTDALEVLRVEIGQYPPYNFQLYEDSEPPIEEVKQIARSTISTILPQHVTFDIV